MTSNEKFTNQANAQTHVENAEASRAPVTPAAQEHVRPLAGRPIQWASTGDLEQELELLKNRQWLNEDLITSSQKHWNCSRIEAVRYLLSGLDECSE